MQNAFPHNTYVAAALVLAAGGLAMTCSILSGDVADIRRLSDAFAEAFRIGTCALVCYAVGRHLNKD
jgi:hypothetical protein